MADGQVWTIGSILKWSEQYFGGHGAETPRLDAEVLLSHLLGENGYISMCISISL